MGGVVRGTGQASHVRFAGGWRGLLPPSICVSDGGPGDTSLRPWRTPSHRHSASHHDRQITRTAQLLERRGCTMPSGFRGFRHASRGPSAQRPHTRRPPLEELESRFVPAVCLTQSNRVADIPGMAARPDRNLVNPGGMALGTNSGLWVAENGAGTAESFDGTGQAIQSAITIPGPGGTGTSAPTGV